MPYLKTLHLFEKLYNVVVEALRKVLLLILYWKIARELGAFEVLFFNVYSSHTKNEATDIAQESLWS